MSKKINEELDDFFDDDLFLSIPEFASLNDDDIFEDYSDYELEDDKIITVDDVEFDRILQNFGSSSKTKDSNTQDKLINLELEYAKLKIEREALEHEKAIFERQKREWEVLKKLSEESFQAEKEEYAKKIRLEKEKMYLETRGIINSCTDIKKEIDDYNN